MENKIRVLLADDHAVLRDGLRLLLEREADIDVVGEAADGEEAIKKAVQLHPDIVVLDIGMPKISGIEAARTIKEKKPNIGILALTVYEDDEHVFNLLKAGASGYLLKKAAGVELANAVRAVHNGEFVFSPSIGEKLLSTYLQEPKQNRAPLPDGLTRREVEVLKLIAQGGSNKDIADKLFISIKTVESHRTNIFRKLGIHDRIQAATYAIRKGLVEESADE
jgi:DNA-binding NarL/FixJ family response regulator